MIRFIHIGHAVRHGLRIMVLLALVLAFHPNAVAASCDVKRDKNGVKVESCDLSDTNFRLVRAETTITGTLGGAVKLLTDAAACPRWRHRCLSETLLNETSDYDKLTQNVSDGGFFASDRISVVRLKWGRAAEKIVDKNTVVFTVVGDDDFPVASPKMVRLRCARGLWILTAAPDGMVNVKHDLVSDPDAPAFFVNGAVVSYAYETLRKMQTEIKNPVYSGVADLPDDVPTIEYSGNIGEQFSQCMLRRK